MLEAIYPHGSGGVRGAALSDAPLTYSVGDIRARRRDDPFRFEADGAALVALLARSKILLNADLAMLT